MVNKPHNHRPLLLIPLFAAWIILIWFLSEHRQSLPGADPAILYRQIKMEQDQYHPERITKRPVFISPVLPNDNRYVTDPHGYREHPKTSVENYHLGIDISGGYRCEILAAAGGVVYETGYNSVDGKYITIIHPDGWRTRYCHLSSVYVKPGQNAGTGEVIGRMGDTGITTGEHLHFEIWHMGADCDPLDYLEITVERGFLHGGKY